jgi:S-DNA-T family DNA segregation ATPase FtsK/SpoIIIE
MDAVKADDVDDDEEDDTSAEQGGMTREERLNAIRAGGAASVLSQATKPEDSTPSTSQASTPPRPASASANTDAYGNAPTPPKAARPDQLRPAPSTPPGAPAQAQKLTNEPREWTLPSINELLNEGSEQDFDRQFLVEQARTIEDTLKSFGAPGRVVEINTGPVITQYGVEPDYLQSRSGKKSRVKVSAIAQLDRDLQLALGAKSIRIEAPVPGKGYVGIEIPNAENALVSLKDVMEASEFQKRRTKSPLSIALGQSVDGTPIAANLDSMPHLLIAGTTGSGKSVCVNSIICSMLSYNSPDDLKFIMVDPKRVELTGYNGIPHLVAPVVVELERIVGVLKWVTREMDERYKRFSSAGARNIVDFNKHLTAGEEKMPYIVVIIDELADLMMLAPEETERTITRIAALARATGIHLVIATQRPSVDVVTGLIKANFPARIAFAVAGSVDSRVILDQPGAERLLGRGDMLYLSGDSPAPMRLQGVFVSDEEIDNITRYWKTQGAGMAPAPTKKMAPLSLDPATAPRQMTPSAVSGVAPSALGGSPGTQTSFWDNSGGSSSSRAAADETPDELYNEAVELVRRQKKASVSMLQRKLRIGYTRSSRLIDMMEERGVIGPQESGSKPREVLPEYRLSPHHHRQQIEGPS